MQVRTLKILYPYPANVGGPMGVEGTGKAASSTPRDHLYRQNAVSSAGPQLAGT